MECLKCNNHNNSGIKVKISNKRKKINKLITRFKMKRKKLIENKGR